MNGIHVLNNMFGYNTPIPDAPVTRQHRIGVYTSGYARTDKDAEREKQRKVVPPKDPNALKDSEKRILMIVKCNNGITAIDAANKTKWTTNHCSMILTALFRKKLITRIKHSQSGTRWYAYHARKV
jgi:DNA-binding MarR family transcriptional regulator